MGDVYGKLTVFFDEPFWVGIFERTENNLLSAVKITFGSEPGDCEVYDFVLKHYTDLKFGPAVQTEVKRLSKNAKRKRRAAKKYLQEKGVGTKAQRAVSMEREQSKEARAVKKREKKAFDARRIFEIKQQKKKEKHRGR